MSQADLPTSLQAAQSRGESEPAPDGVLARAGARFTDWALRFIPDAYVFALLATVLVVGASVVTLARTRGAVPAFVETCEIWGGGFWELLPFTLQMCLVIITGYVLATTRPVYALIARLAVVPKSGRSAVPWIAFLAMTTSWVNWGFSLIFSAMLVRESARRVPNMDYRAAAASAFLGLGSVWAQGLSGSAALQMASPSSLQPAIRTIVEGGDRIPGGIIPLTHTIFLWQSAASVVIEIVLVTILAYSYAPGTTKARTAAMLGIDLGPSPLDAPAEAAPESPSDWLERTPWLSWAFVAFATTYLIQYFRRADSILGAIQLNTVNLVFLTLGVLLHRTPGRLLRAFKEATPGVWGVILQFPLYAGLAALMVKTGLSESIATFFVRLSTRETFPALVAVYSAVLGVFVPSGGSKWVIEAPYVMQAAHDLQVHLGWMVAVYDLGEALANLIQPFWMLPILGLLGLRAKDIMGYTFLVFLVLLPTVLVLVTLLGLTLRYPL